MNFHNIVLRSACAVTRGRGRLKVEVLPITSDTILDATSA